MINLSDLDIIALNQKTKDSNLDRKKELTDRVEYFDGIPQPSIVEISESGTCNRKCSFCPRSAPDFLDVKNFISSSLVLKLAEQLGELNYSGLILFSGFVEPLLDKNISDHLKCLREKVPHAQIEVVTNGDPLTKNVLKKILNSGLNRVLVSCYDGPHQVDELRELCAQCDVDFGVAVLARPRWTGASDSFDISLSNRGGLMENAEFSIPSLNTAFTNPCNYPAQTFFMDYQGDVLMCAHDWGKKLIMGNLYNESFWEIWTGRKYSFARSQLLAGKRQSLKPCDVCNVEGTRMGAEHASAWASEYAKLG